MDYSYEPVLTLFEKTVLFLREHWLDGLVATLVFLAIFYLSGIIRKYTFRTLNKLTENKAIANLLAATIRAAVILAGAFAALSILGLDDTILSILAGAGIFSLVLGFALKDIVSNYFAGLLIVFKHPFRIGDFVKAGNYEGRVTHITLATTVVETFTGQVVHIPNSNVFAQGIENLSGNGTRRLTVKVGVHYDSNLEFVQQVVSAELNKLDFILQEPQALVDFESFQDSSIGIIIRFWIEYPKTEFYHARSEVIKAVHTAFADRGITIPYPITQFNFPSDQIKEVIYEK